MFSRVVLAVLFLCQLSMGFVVVPQSSSPQHQRLHAPVTTSLSPRSLTTQLFFFGQPKDDGSPGDYLCPVGTRTSNYGVLLLF